MKKTKVLILIIVLILVLVCGVFAYLYFGTDMFKSNKKMFNKYAAQISLEEFANFKDYEEFSKRILSQSHTNEGTVSLKFGEDIDETFRFETKNRIDQKAASGEITYSQDGEEKLKVAYLKNDSLYGLQCIYNQYMALDREELPEFAKKLGIDLNEITEPLNAIKNENGQIEINEEEVEEILERIKNTYKKYIKIVIEEIPDKNYSKIKKEEIVVDGNTIQADGYKLTLTQKDLLKIAKKVADTAKDDEELYEIFKYLLEKEGEYQNFTFADYQETFEVLDIDSDLEDIEEDNFKIDVIAYRHGNKLVKLYSKLVSSEEENIDYIDFSIENNKTIKLNQVFPTREREKNIVLSKSTSNEENLFNLRYINKNAYVTVEVDCLMSLKCTNLEKYETNLTYTVNIDDLSLDDNETFRISFDNITEFKDNIEIENFDEVDYISLNTLTEEQIERILADLGEKISQRIDFEKTLTGSMSGSLFEAASTATAMTKETQERETLIAVVVGSINVDGEINFENFKVNAENAGFEVIGNSLPCTCVSNESSNEFSVEEDGKVTILNATENNWDYDGTSTAAIETRKAQVREAMALAKADILYNYYSGNEQEVTPTAVKQLIEQYLYDDFIINVTKDPTGYKFIVSAEGLDLGGNNVIDLTSIENNISSTEILFNN